MEWTEIDMNWLDEQTPFESFCREIAEGRDLWYNRAKLEWKENKWHLKLAHERLAHNAHTFNNPTYGHIKIWEECPREYLIERIPNTTLAEFGLDLDKVFAE